MEKNVKSKVYHILYAVVLLSVSLPIACNYIPEGGEMSMWLARLESLVNAMRQGSFELFPTMETVVTFDGQGNAFDSNLWLVAPALLQMLVKNYVLVYRVLMLFVQVGTLFAAMSLFKTLFKKEWSAFFGTLFYMTWPYRVYITYDQVDWGRSIAFMLMPLFVQMLIVLYTQKGKWTRLLISAVLWAGIAYADWVIAFILAAITMVSAIWYKKWKALFVVMIGVVCYLPGMVHLANYLLFGGMEQWGLPLSSIMPNGYTVGRFFAAFMYKDGYPGIGLGLLGALMILVGMCFVQQNFTWKKQYNFAVFMTVVLVLASLKMFPWDLAQRIGAPIMRMIALWEAPTVFFGCAGIPLSILGAYAMEEIEAKDARRWEIAIAIAAACIGVTIYTCNTLTFSRLPLNF